MLLYRWIGTAANGCTKDALVQAKKLLAFHVDNDDRAAVDDNVTVLPSIRNPVNPKQTFAVLETWGWVYKARYRMHLIYWVDASACILMGQEILEYANL